jgi:xanthine dehydrogenase small subunit
MRDYLLFYVNGKRYSIRGPAAFVCLADFLRFELRLTGTKVVCAEGDCGACTVLIGRVEGDQLRYETVDSCIQFLYQVDGKHVVTVEGLKSNGCLHPIQQAMVEHHGSQCGFCTPGFVMALAGMVEEKTSLEAMRLALTGNLCRCTGYLPILEAYEELVAAAPSAVERYKSTSIINDLRDHAMTPVLIECTDNQPTSGTLQRTCFAPRSLDDALAFKAQHPDAVIVSGATELGVLRNKKGYDPTTVLTLTNIPCLGEINCSDHSVAIGANVTWRLLESFSKDLLPEFYQIIIRFGSPQIRNVSTLAANIANGSPIADSLPLLFIMDAELELASEHGRRRIKINDFFRGYKIKDLAPDEIITQVFLPLPAPDELLKLYKVSKRNDLDIATFAAGIRVKQAGNIITRAFIAYSGVAPTVVRLTQTEAFLQGKLLAEEVFQQAGDLARREIKPISDVRGSRDFRLQLAENILMKFYFDSIGAGIGEPTAITP